MPLPQNPWTLDRLTVPDTALVLSPLFAEYLLAPDGELRGGAGRDDRLHVHRACPYRSIGTVKTAQFEGSEAAVAAFPGTSR